MSFEDAKTWAAFGGLALGVINLARDVWKEFRRAREDVRVRLTLSILTLDGGKWSERVLRIHVVNRSEHLVEVQGLLLQGLCQKREQWLRPGIRTDFRALPKRLEPHGATNFAILRTELGDQFRFLGGRFVRARLYLSTEAEAVSNWLRIDWKREPSNKFEIR